MSFLSLPAELQEHICSFLTCQGDLARLSQASKSLNSISERFLYQSVHITSVAQVGRFVRSVERRDRARHVRTFKLDVYDMNFSVYDWAARQLPETNVDRDAYLEGLKFAAHFLRLFPRIEDLSLHAHQRPNSSVQAELERAHLQGALNALRSCSLAFAPIGRTLNHLHWDFTPFHKIFSCSQLAGLELIRAAGDGPILLNRVNAEWTNYTCALTSLRLLDCHLSHRWLEAYLRRPVALRELEVVVASEKAASFAEHMFLERCSCLEPLCSTLESLSYVNLRSVPRTHHVHQFAMFEILKELMVSATELFGDMSQHNIQTVLRNLDQSMPHTLRVLRLYVHTLDIYGDVEGHSQGVWKVLGELLKTKNRARAPQLQEIVLHIIAKLQVIPPAIVSRASASGVNLRLATTDEKTKWRERQRLRMLMS